MEVIQITEVPDENGVAQQQQQVSAENLIWFISKWISRFLVYEFRIWLILWNRRRNLLRLVFGIFVFILDSAFRYRYTENISKIMFCFCNYSFHRKICQFIVRVINLHYAHISVIKFIIKSRHINANIIKKNYLRGFCFSIHWLNWFRSTQAQPGWT